MPKKLKNTQRLKAYKKDEEDTDNNTTTKGFIIQKTIRSDDTGSEGRKLLACFDVFSIKCH